MASQQARRRDVTDERNIEVEKDRVPKMTTHFESLAEKARGEQDVAHPLQGERIHFQVEAVPVRVGGIEYSAAGEKGSEREVGKEKKAEEGGRMGSQMHTGRGEEQQHVGHHRSKEMQGKAGGEEGRRGTSLEEISNLRSTAQQNSMEAIRAAEERYEKAKEMGAKKAEESQGQARDTTSRGRQERSEHATEKGGSLKDTALEKGQQGKDYTTQKAVEAKGMAMEKGQQAKDYTAEKAAEAKDVISSKGQYVAEKGQQAKDYTAQKAMEAKDVISSKGQSAAEKGQQAKDYTAQKAVEAKDVISSKGQSAAQLAAEKGQKAKDYTAQKAMEARIIQQKRRLLLRMVRGRKSWRCEGCDCGKWQRAAGYTGEKVVAAKDKVASAGQTVAGYAGEKLAAAKDAVVASEEKAREYAARKKAEAEKDLQVKKSSPEKVLEVMVCVILGLKYPSDQVDRTSSGDLGRPTEGGETFTITEQHDTRAQVEVPSEKFREAGRGGPEAERKQPHVGEGEGKQLHAGEGEEKHQQGESTAQQQGGSIVRAIGETLVEIGQTTKDLLVGQYPAQVVEQKDEAAPGKDEPYTGPGGGI
ncbi:UNVERIFIED_CONTAM: hypothetical protein Scaly_2258800 [Sesamum calycinum]|uniref:Seed biotin-containing protein SBP65 n=1 Tax=Sesamum calycinum TaxID=2727403 RepID=A0AAW2M9U7_9LAMI